MTADRRAVVIGGSRGIGRAIVERLARDGAHVVATGRDAAALDRLRAWRWFVDEPGERALVEEYRRMLNIRMAGPEQLVVNLSGGNQQKVVLARWLALRPKVLIVDEPTRGIDIGAKAGIYAAIDELARGGAAILLVSSYIPELIGVCDRIAVMRRGDLGEARPVAAWSEPALLAAAIGVRSKLANSSSGGEPRSCSTTSASSGSRARRSRSRTGSW